MITLSKVTVSEPPSPRATCRVCGSVNVPQPSNSVILFFFIRKCTPLTRPSATVRLRSKATPKSKVTSPEMPNVFASSRTRWASSALRSRALDGMQPTLRHTPPQYLLSTTATLLPSCAARMAATYPPGPAPRTTTSKCGMCASLEPPPWELLVVPCGVGHGRTPRAQRTAPHRPLPRRAHPPPPPRIARPWATGVRRERVSSRERHRRGSTGPDEGAPHARPLGPAGEAGLPHHRPVRRGRPRTGAREHAGGHRAG